MSWTPWPKSTPAAVALGLWSGLYGVASLLGAAVFWCLRWARLELRDGAVDVVCRGPLAAWMVTHGWGGYTMGWCIWYWDEIEAASPNVRRHERQHVQQYLRLGLLMPFVYLLLLVCWGYEGNPLEVAARDAAKEFPE